MTARPVDIPAEMRGKTQVLYMLDEIEKGRNPFDAIDKWAEAHPLPEDIFHSEDECWRILDELRSRGSLTPSELHTLQFAVDELETMQRRGVRSR